MIIEALCVECIIIQVDVIEAEAEFSKLIRLLESKTEHSITIARNCVQL